MVIKYIIVFMVAKTITCNWNFMILPVKEMFGNISNEFNTEINNLGSSKVCQEFPTTITISNSSS